MSSRPLSWYSPTASLRNDSTRTLPPGAGAEVCGGRLTHPAQHIEKEYEVLLDRPFDPNHIPRLLRGFRLESGPARAERIQVLAGAQLRVVLRQGMKRQIRVMFYRLGYEVKRLLRIRIGGLQLSKLSPGEWRALRAREVALLTAGDKKKS